MAGHQDRAKIGASVPGNRVPMMAPKDLVDGKHSQLETISKCEGVCHAQPTAGYSTGYPRD